MAGGADYFTFLDGAFFYDCPSCGQACCRGKGMALDAARELVPLLVREPRIAPLMSVIPGGLAGWADVSDGCWFLRTDGLCRVETEHGRDVKPTTCRLFPFNRVFRAGQVRVVDFNSVICPLQDAGSGGRAGVTYRELLEDLKSVPDGPLTNSQAPLPAGAEGRWEKLERAVLEASRDHLARPAAEFCAFQETAATGSAPAASSERMAGLAASWNDFHGLPPGDDPAVSRALALLTPSLRFNTLFRRNGPPWAAAAARLPRLMLATAHMARAAAALKGPLSLRAITELHQNTAPLRELLARWDEPAILVTERGLGSAAQPLALNDAPPDLAMLVRRAAEALSPFRGPARPLGLALAEAWGGVPGPGRSMALALLARSGAELRFQEA